MPTAKKAQTVLGFHSSSKCVMQFFVDLLCSSMKVDSLKYYPPVPEGSATLRRDSHCLVLKKKKNGIKTVKRKEHLKPGRRGSGEHNASDSDMMK